MEGYEPSSISLSLCDYFLYFLYLSLKNMWKSRLVVAELYGEIKGCATYEGTRRRNVCGKDVDTWG